MPSAAQALTISKKLFLEQDWETQKGCFPKQRKQSPLFKRERKEFDKTEVWTAGGDFLVLSRTVAPAALYFVRTGLAFGSEADTKLGRYAPEHLWSAPKQPPAMSIQSLLLVVVYFVARRRRVPGV